MELERLLAGVEYEYGPAGPKAAAFPSHALITGVTEDSRKVTPGTVFVCVTGSNADGHKYAVQAAEKGCAAVVALHMTDAAVPHILVKDTRVAYSLISANFFGNPAKELKLVGVTGTNGKTTTAFLLKQILEKNGHRSGLIGTIQNMAGDEILPARFTTPEPFELQQTFRKIADAGCEYCVMEVSSQALAQERVSGCRFEAGIFTNLTQDHLDYHKTMENYLAAKEKLFSISKLGVINLDDPYSNDFLKTAGCKTYTYSSLYMNADFTARNVRLRSDGIDYELVGTGVIGRVSAAIPGSFSVYNTLAAASCALCLGIPLKGVTDAIGGVKGVKGRIEVVPTGRDFTVIIDYAHTPDALEKILKAVHGFAKGRVVVLFGCGGDRDRSKRPIMGAVAAHNADFLIVTSDNPRTEDPSAIISDIIPGIEDAPYVVIENRREAIAYALENARPDDIVLLAGKGHEDYQIIGREKHHFDEREVVAEVLAGLLADR